MESTKPVGLAKLSQNSVNRKNAFMTKWIFKFTLIKRAYTKKQFEVLVAKTKFGKSKIQENQIGLEIWLEKQLSA